MLMYCLCFLFSFFGVVVVLFVGFDIYNTMSVAMLSLVFVCCAFVIVGVVLCLFVCRVRYCLYVCLSLFSIGSVVRTYPFRRKCVYFCFVFFVFCFCFSGEFDVCV